MVQILRLTVRRRSRQIIQRLKLHLHLRFLLQKRT